MSDDGLSRITPRQLEILDLVSKGLRNREVSDVLGISLSTVKVHVAAILRTLGVANRTEAVYEYREALGNLDDRQHRIAALAREVGRPAIAVLRFDDRSRSGPPLELSAALQQDLVTRLSSWRWLPVLSTSATRDLDPAEPDFAHLRTTLGAGYALVGRIQSQTDGEAERFRVHAELVEVATEQIVWSTSHDFAGRELFDLQDAVCRSVVARIAPELVRLDAQIAPRRAEPGFEAWSLASRGMLHVMRATREDSQVALDLVAQALERDPDLVMAWYVTAAAHYQRVFHQWSDTPVDDLAAFHRAAARGTTLDPHDSSSQEIFGFSRMIDGRYDEAIEHLERAVELNPSNAQAYSELGQALAHAGRPDEGIAQLEEALRLAPTGDSAWSTTGGIAIAHLIAGRPAEAEHWARRAQRLDPDAATMFAILAAAQAAAGDARSAERTLADLRRLDPRFDVARMIAMMRPSFPRLAGALDDAFGAAGLVGS